jgi:flagellar hook-basal body complex protein FliE
MDFLSANQVSGDMMTLKRTHPLHLNPAGEMTNEKQRGTGFGQVLMDALNGVNNLQQESTSISQQALIDPESVDAHDVTLAMSKANLSLSITKAVVDKALRAYQEITNLR